MTKSIFDPKDDAGEASLVTNVATQELIKAASSEDAGDISVDSKTLQALVVKNTEKRVSRYSERRNKIKERFSQRENTIVSNEGAEKASEIDLVESVSGGIETIQIDTVKREDVTATSGETGNIETQ